MSSTDGTAAAAGRWVIEAGHLQDLLDALSRRGFQTWGPTVRDGAIVYDEIGSCAELPAGWTDRQEAGLYRLEHRADQALFGYAVGPHSWKRLLHPPRRRLFQAHRLAGGFEIAEEPLAGQPLALLGVRSCELHAIEIQDRVFLGGEFVQPHYASRREDLFLVAVNCGTAGGTCFCVSMQTGPRARDGFDIALTEIVDERRHLFTAEAASERGAEVLRDVRRRPAEPGDLSEEDRVLERTAASMGRVMDTGGIRQLLCDNPDHPSWEEVASRCLSCANCTMVCPTCFCTTVEDASDLSGDHAERWQRWDSCFTMDFSYLHGGSVRASVQSRYRQWMTHKLATWFDQFGSSGCVGCGRCITWCPVGIDITEQVRHLRERTP